MQISKVGFYGVSNPQTKSKFNSKQYAVSNAQGDDTFVKSETENGTVVSAQKFYVPSFGAKKPKLPDEISAKLKNLGIDKFKEIDQMYYEPFTNTMLKIDKKMTQGRYLSSTVSTRGEYYFPMYDNNRELSELLIVTDNSTNIMKIKDGKVVSRYQKDDKTGREYLDFFTADGNKISLNGKITQGKDNDFTWSYININNIFDEEEEYSKYYYGNKISNINVSYCDDLSTIKELIQEGIIKYTKVQ